MQSLESEKSPRAPGGQLEMYRSTQFRQKNREKRTGLETGTERETEMRRTGGKTVSEERDEGPYRLYRCKQNNKVTV